MKGAPKEPSFFLFFVHISFNAIAHYYFAAPQKVLKNSNFGCFYIKTNQTVQNIKYKFVLFVQKVKKNFSLDNKTEKCYNKP